MTDVRQPGLTDLARTFRLLADEDHLAILHALRDGSRPVPEVSRAVGLSHGVVAHHLTALEGAGLVRVRQDPGGGPHVVASLEPSAWHGIMDLLDGFARLGADEPSDGRDALLVEQPYFAVLPKADLNAVIQALLPERHEAGSVLVAEGERCPGLYLVAEGRVKTYTTSPEGREQILRITGPGDTFNEVPAFDGGPNPASAAAIDPATVYLLPIEQVQALLRGSPAFAAAVSRVLAARLRHLVALVEDLSFRHVMSRVAKILLQTVQPGGRISAGSGHRPLTQREMAEMAGTAREVVSRVLRNLERQGMIHVERGRITIIDRARLEALAQGRPAL